MHARIATLVVVLLVLVVPHTGYEASAPVGCDADAGEAKKNFQDVRAPWRRQALWHRWVARAVWALGVVACTLGACLVYYR